MFGSDPEFTVVQWTDLPDWVKEGVYRTDKSPCYWRGMIWFKSSNSQTYAAYERTGAYRGEFHR